MLRSRTLLGTILLAATGVKRCASRTSAKARAGFVVFAIGSDPTRSACCTVAISSWPLHNQKCDLSPPRAAAVYRQSQPTTAIA